MGSVLGSKLGVAPPPRPTGLREMLVVVGIAAAGVLFAAVLALGPWIVAGPAQSPVIQFQPPAITAPHG
jgi:hypothetical protein